MVSGKITTVINRKVTTTFQRFQQLLINRQILAKVCSVFRTIPLTPPTPLAAKEAAKDALMESSRFVYSVQADNVYLDSSWFQLVYLNFILHYNSVIPYLNRVRRRMFSFKVKIPPRRFHISSSSVPIFIILSMVKFFFRNLYLC